MRTAIVEQRLTEIRETPKSPSGTLSSVDPKKTGARYVVTATVLLRARKAQALILRIQLSPPDQLILTPVIYDQIFPVRGFTTIFWCGSPIVSRFREGARCRGDSGRVPCGCGMHEPAGCFALPGDRGRQCARGPAKNRSQGCSARHTTNLRISMPHRLVGPPLYFSSRRTTIAGKLPANLVRWLKSPQSMEPTRTCRA